MNVKAVTTTDSQVSAQIAATTPSSQANSSEKQDSFVSALDQRLKSEDPVEREAAMRRQLSRSIRRSTGTDTQGSVSEEALFAGMVGMQLLESKGRDVYEQYADRVRALTSGSDPQEKSFEVAAKKVLKEIQDSSKVPQAKVDTMYSTAFASSQLDTNTNALYDSLGGKGGQDYFRDNLFVRARFRNRSVIKN